MFALHPLTTTHQNAQFHFFSVGTSTEQQRPISAIKNKSNDSNTTTFAIDYGIYVTVGDESLTIRLVLPGIYAKDLQVSLLENGILHVSGNFFDKKFKMNHMMNHPWLDTENIRGHLSNGVLKLTVPKKCPTPYIRVPVKEQIPPPVLNDNDSYLAFIIDVPGVQLQDLSLEYDNETFKIQTKRSIGAVATASRSFTVNEKYFDCKKLEAYLCCGVLTIAAPRKKLRNIQQTIVITSDDDQGSEEVKIQKTTIYAKNHGITDEGETTLEYCDEEDLNKNNNEFIMVKTVKMEED